MVTALRSGPPPIPPAQQSRTTDSQRLPEFVRGLPRMDGATAPVRLDSQRQDAPEAPRRISAPEPSESSRPARPARPGSILDIRV